jgi:hypothetical protein
MLHFSEEQLDDSRVSDLTRLEELHEVVVIRSAKHQHAMRRYHMRNICSRSFQLDDFTLQKIQMTKDRHKLFSTWEGPHEEVGMTRPGSYRLWWDDGSESSKFLERRLVKTFLYVGNFLYIFVYCVLHWLMRPILQSRGCIMYSYIFHIMKYYLCCICFIFVQTTSLPQL